jgi:hypothetical protein
MLNKDWKPENVQDLKGQVEALKIKIKPELPAEEVTRMQLEVLSFASGLTWPVNESRLYETRCIGEKNRAFTNAFLTAEGSDRKRDAEAKSDSKYRIAEVKAQEAEIYRKLLEDVKQDFIAIHYALRAMLKDKTEEKKYGY